MTGIDIHPVAVIFARVTYLLALMPALRGGHPGQVALPVYLGDALQWNLARTAEKGAQPDLLVDEQMLEIFVPPVTLTSPKPQRLGAATLRFPAGVAADARLLDRILRSMIDFGDRGATPDEFDAWAQREDLASPTDRRVLVATFEAMRRLQQEGRNHIWGHVARNLARPVWLASDVRKADVVVGNPPWVSFRYMSAEFQKRFREECRASRLWVGGNVATQQDLASYFYMRAALLYMRRSGRIALVLPYAALSRRAYSAFHKGEVAQAGHVVFRLRFTEAWTFGPDVRPLFPVPSCVLFAEAGTNLAAAVVQDEEAIIDHKLYWAPADSLGEARYLCGLLNSAALLAGVRRFQSQGQWGARDFDKYVFNLPIPRFDENDELHRRIAAAAETAEEVAASVPSVEGEYFTRTRSRVRAALADHGVAAELERLAGEIFSAE